ncbi:MAG: MMPL family transporter [Clostridiales bacterium]|nr:MMPL family transporter [Clostridiales bacterium]
MKKLAAFIVKSRHVLTGLFAVCVVVSALFIPKVKTNYDITEYLADDSPTVQALDKMEAEFGATGTANVMVKNVSESEAEELKATLAGVDGVANVLFESDNSRYYNKEKQCALFAVFLKDGNFEPGAHAAVKGIRAALSGHDIALSGQSVDSAYLQEAVQKDMTVILLISGAVIFLILLLTSSSWIDPLLFAIVIVGSIIMNLGTNALLPDISFITKSICAVMQLALAMDYSIMLLHRYNEEVRSSADKNRKDALITALAKTFAPVSASSLTTVAGLVALMFMSFTLGFDIGIVLAKGVLLSLFTVFLFMPGFLLLFAPLLEKTKHRSLHEVLKDALHRNREKRNRNLQAENALDKSGKPRRVRTFADFQFKSRHVVPIVLLLLIVGGMITQSTLGYDYAMETAKNKNEAVVTEKQAITDTFGYQNSLVVMVPKGNAEAELSLTNAILSLQSNEKSVVSDGTGMAAKGLRFALSAQEISAAYGIDEALVSAAIAAATEGESDRILLSDLLAYMNESNFAASLANAKQAELEAVADAAETLLNDPAADETQKEALRAEKTHEELTQAFSLPSQVTDIVFSLASSPSEAPTTAMSTYKFLTTAKAWGAVSMYGNLVQSQIGEAYETVKSAAATLDSAVYTRIIFNVNLPASGDETFAFIGAVRKTVADYYADGYVMSESSSFTDISEAFSKDIVLVNLLSFFAVFLIVMLTYRSLAIPALLTLVIQGAIWLSMGLNGIAGIPIYFICALIVMCIQMGATIDYAILLTGRYVEARKTLSRRDAVAYAFDTSLTTVLTSGSILVIAAFIVGLASRMSLIAGLGLLLARGCLISVLAVIFALPQVLLLCDKLLEKTTLKCKFFDEKEQAKTLTNSDTENVEGASFVIPSVVEGSSEQSERK